MVGLPEGQFHGDLRSARLSRMRLMVVPSRVLPIMMEEQQALMASIAHTLHHFFFGTPLELALSCLNCPQKPSDLTENLV